MDSKLQIISGRFRGRKLRLPPDARPTQNRARIALFNMISALDITPNIIWDVFAGSGAFGLECISRYENAQVIFTDAAASSIATVRQNLTALGANAVVEQMDAFAALGRYGARADLIFIDPPYSDSTQGGAFVRRVGKLMRPGTILIWEQDNKSSIIPDDGVWDILRDRRYGRARFLILRKKN